MWVVMVGFGLDVGMGGFGLDVGLGVFRSWMIFLDDKRPCFGSCEVSFIVV